MSAFNSKESSTKVKNDKGSKQNPITEISKKGKTLGAQHSSHGDMGAERQQRKGKTAKNR